jgi:hypothetical protein
MLTRILTVTIIYIIWLIYAICAYGIEIEGEFSTGDMEARCILYNNGYIFMGNKYSAELLKMDITNGDLLSEMLDDRIGIMWLYASNDNEYIIAWTADRMQQNRLDKIRAWNLQIEGSALLPDKVSYAIMEEESGHIFAVSGPGNKLFVIDGVTMGIMKEFNVAEYPQWVIINEDKSKAFVSCAKGEKVCVFNIDGIDAGNYYWVKDTVVGEGPSIMSYSESRNTVYVCCIGSGSVDVLDGDSGDKINEYFTGERSCIVDYDEVHDSLWVSQGIDDSRTYAYVYNIELLNEEIESFSKETRLVYGGLFPDCGHYLAIIDPDDIIWIINAESFEEEALDYGEGLLFFDFGEDGCAYIIDAKAKRVLKVRP